MGRKHATLDERQEFVRAVQQRVLETGQKDVQGVCAEHPGWNRQTVSRYFNMYERGESLQPKRRPSPNALVRQTALLPPQMQQSVRPAARAMGLPNSTVHDHLDRTLQDLQHVQAVGNANWSSDDADALDKEARYLGMGDESMDMAQKSITNDRLAKIIADNHQQGSRVRLIVDEAKANEKKNLKWLRAFKRAGIPIRSGCTASQTIHTKWSVLDGVNGPFVLGGTGNFSANAFLPGQIETFWTRTSRSDIDYHKGLFEKVVGAQACTYMDNFGLRFREP